MRNKKNLQNEINEIEILIGTVLRIGVSLAGLVMLIGLIMFIITGYGGYANNFYPTSTSSIFKGIFALKPIAIMMFGLFLLILTPALRVLVSIIAFTKEKDYLYVLITWLFLLVLVCAIFIGHRGHGM